VQGGSCGYWEVEDGLRTNREGCFGGADFQGRGAEGGGAVADQCGTGPELGGRAGRETRFPIGSALEA